LTNDPISEITPDIAGSETRLHNYVSLPSLNEVFDENSPEGHIGSFVKPGSSEVHN
jgi:hypothetical protein